MVPSQFAQDLFGRNQHLDGVVRVCFFKIIFFNACNPVLICVDGDDVNLS